VLICGGKDQKGIAKGMTLEYVDSNSRLTIKPEMLEPRYGHRLVPISYQDIFAIGGQRSDYRNTKTCEWFDMRANQWKQASGLSFPRSEMSACLIGSKYIYVFGGFNVEENTYYSLHVERFNLEQKTFAAWRHLNVVYGKDFQLTEFVNAGITIDITGKIMIFGGKDSRGNLLDQVFLFDRKGEAFNSDMKLSEADEFSDGNIVWRESTLFAYSKKSNKLHYLDSDMIWKCTSS